MIVLGREMEADFHTKFNTQGVKSSQNLWELQEFLTWTLKEIVKYPDCFGKFKPIKYLEIGSYAGESLYYISQILPAVSKIVLVDLGDNHIARSILHVVVEYVRDKYEHNVQLVTGDSTDKTMVQTVKDNYDLCFIDANHSFDYARADYENYGPMATRVAFHDISRDNIERSRVKHGGVYQAVVGHLWEGIKATVNQKPPQFGGPQIELDNWFEIVDNRNTLDKPRGFGVIYGGKFG